METALCLIACSDSLTHAYTVLEDHDATGKVREESLRRTHPRPVLVEERDRANGEVSRYKEEIGLRPA